MSYHRARGGFVFCNKCGGELPPNKALCPHCGKQVPPEAIRMTMPAQVVWTPQPSIHDPHAELRAQYPDLQGVGGWLGTYAWLQLTFVPLYYLSQIVNPKSILWVALGSPIFVLNLGLAVYGMVVGYLIVTKSPFALWNAKLKLALHAILGICSFALAIKSGVPTGLTTVAGAALWYAYFSVSKRVKLTLDPPLSKAN